MENSPNLTQQKKIEKALREEVAELKRSNEELEQFAHIVVHDLKEPLRNIKNCADLFIRKSKENIAPESKQYLEQIQGGIERINLMIDDLLAYSRLNCSGREIIPVDFNLLLQEIIGNKRHLFKKTKTEITLDPLPTLLADESQIQQLFENLISNALKFHGPTPPKILISAAEKGREWVFSVKDQGIGFKQEYADKIFLLLQRLHSYKEYPGTGIGLTICKKIVERHQGKIWAESALGEGATFYFTLPLANIT